MARESTPSCAGCAARDETIAWLQEKVLELLQIVASQEARIRGLEAQLKQTSRNSHKPPSSDPPGTAKPERKRSSRKPGGQPGHEGKTRELLPPEQVDHFFPVFPDRCGHCGERLPPGEGDPSPVRHQVTEIPPVKPEVTEYQLHAVSCPWCGELTRAVLPDGVPTGAFGPRLTAVVAVLTGAYRLSKRNVAQILEDLFGVKVALGSVANLERATSQALADPVEEVREHVKEVEVVHADETSWRQRRKKAWLWTAVTASAAVFLIRGSRGRKVAEELLGAEPGIVVSDRYSAYGWIPVRDRQACWSHLKRDFQKIADAGGDAAPVGAALLACEKRLFDWWHRVREGALKRSSFRTYVSGLRVKIRDLLIEGTMLWDDKSAGMCKQILKVESALYTFARLEGVEPTNNRAETNLRHAVIWRKTSFGTHSRAGSDYVERILTVVATLRLQRRNVLEYLTAACRAALNGDTAPSLVPPSAHRVTSVA